MDDIHNLLCDLILKHESTSPGFVWGFQCSLLGSKIHYLGQEKSNSLHGSTQVVNIHYLGQIHNLGQSISIAKGQYLLSLQRCKDQATCLQPQFAYYPADYCMFCCDCQNVSFW